MLKALIIHKSLYVSQPYTELINQWKSSQWMQIMEISSKLYLSTYWYWILYYQYVIVLFSSSFWIRLKSQAHITKYFTKKMKKGKMWWHLRMSDWYLKMSGVRFQMHFFSEYAPFLKNFFACICSPSVKLSYCIGFARLY